MKTEQLVSIETLQQEREMWELKRKHALQAAVKFYRVTDDKEGLEILRRVVFGNWLQAHAETKEFQPMEFIGA